MNRSGNKINNPPPFFIEISAFYAFPLPVFPQQFQNYNVVLCGVKLFAVISHHCIHNP